MFRGGTFDHAEAFLLTAPNTAQTIAISLHELATNAVKYGSLSAADGRVEIAWSSTAEAIPQIGVQRRRGAAAVEVSFMQDVKRWGVLTTGLGNARFSNRNGKGER